MAQHANQRRSGAGALAAQGFRAAHASSHLRDMWHHVLHRFGALLTREAEHRTPFLWLPVAFGLGILVYFAAPQEPLAWHGPLLAGIALLPATLDTGWRKALGMALLFAALGFSAATWRTRQVATPMLAREMIAEVKGFVETMDEGNGRLRLLLRPVSISEVPPAAMPRALRLGVPGASEIAPGDFVVLRARLSPPSEASMPGGYDFRRDSFFKGVGGVGYSLGKPSAQAAPAPPPLDLAFKAFVDRARNALTQRIATSIGGQSGALSAALITGKRGLISETTNDDLRASGLYHIVSISGIHMVLAAGVLFWSVRALLAAFVPLALRWPIKKIAAVFAMLGATFYCIFSGSEVATERSLIMTLVMLGAILADRPALAMRNLALSALIVLTREPESLLGPSFQMSFAAVACLIGANRVWQDWRRNHPPREHAAATRLGLRIALGFLGIGATTLVATLATGPFSVFHFHRVNPFGLIGNALALPLVSMVVMPAAVIGTLLAPLDLDWIVWRIMGEGVSGVLFVAEWVGGMENASYAVARLTLPTFGLMVLALLVFTGFQTRLRALALVPLAMLLLVPMHPPAPDIITDPTGKSALVRVEDGSFRLLAQTASNRFTLAQWLPAVGDSRLPRDATLRKGVMCDKSGCTTARAPGRAIALSLTPDALREDCLRAEIIITPLPAIKGCTARLVLDKTHFQRNGANFVTYAGLNTQTAAAPAKAHPNLDAPGNGAFTLTTALDPTSHRPWRRAPPPGKDAGLARAGLGPWLEARWGAPRTDGKRFFGLLPAPARQADAAEETLTGEEDPAMAQVLEDAGTPDTETVPAGEAPQAPGSPPPEMIQ